MPGAGAAKRPEPAPGWSLASSGQRSTTLPCQTISAEAGVASDKAASENNSAAVFECERLNVGSIPVAILLLIKSRLTANSRQQNALRDRAEGFGHVCDQNRQTALDRCPLIFRGWPDPS